MNSFALRLRSIARRVGLARLHYLWIRSQSNYEEKFHSALEQDLRPGDVVWDVGANSGVYTRIFAEKVGPSGHVIAFEPAPGTYLELCGQTQEFPWVRNEQAALSNFDGTSRLVAGAATTLNHIGRLPGESETNDSVEILVMRGDTYGNKSGTIPSLVKIDVEGFEEEVLEGLGALLDEPKLRAVFLEVHFRLLEARGSAKAPIRTQELLRSKGLEPKWVDPSHMVARRAGA